MRIRRATVADAEALAEFGARTFFETFAADNTAEDMRLFLESTWRPDLQRAEIQDPGLDTLLACDDSVALAGFAQLRAGASAGGYRRARAGGAQTLLRRQALAGPGPGAHAHGGRRAGRRARAERASYGWVSGSAMSARRRSIASAAFARWARRSSSSARIRRPINVMLRELE